MPFSSLEETGAAFGRTRDAVSRTGRTAPMVYSAAQVLCVGRDEGEIARRAERIGRAPEELRADGLAGSPAELVDKIGRFAEAGAERLYLQVLDMSDLDHLALVAEQVAPQVD